MQNFYILCVSIFALVTAFSCDGTKTETEYVAVEIPGVPPPATGPINVPIPVPSTPSFVSFEAFESENLTEVTGLVTDEQRQTRYLTVCDQFNAGLMTDVMKQGVVKGLNQLSIENDLEPGVWVGANKCTLRFFLEDYGLDALKWQAIEAADNLNFESFTDRGLLLKQLTQARKPWMTASNFLEIALTNEVYYTILEVPVDEAVFLNDYLGCDLQADFDNFARELFMAGVRRSLIALQKNRSLWLNDNCKEGTVSATYDVIQEAVTTAGRNLSINPFPVEARTNLNFQEDASEYIFGLPNGLMGYALFANGIRENAAPTNVVVDNTKADIDATIRNARSCSNCHVNGFIEVDDFIAQHVTGNPGFDVEDIQKAQFFFGRNDGMKAAIRQANSEYQQRLAQIGVSTDTSDPINELTDMLRREMTLKQVAAIYFMSEAEFSAGLRQSPNGLLAVGQLLQGGTINLQDLSQISATLVRDMNIFQEDLGR